MIYREDLIGILRTVVESMDFTVTINSVEETDGTYVITTCDIYHAEPGRTVTIGGETFTITAIDADEKTISVTTEAELAEDFWTGKTSFALYSPYFFHGTPIDTNKQLKDINRAQDKTPMVWLHEQYQEDFSENNRDVHERVSDFRIFFLTQSDHTDETGTLYSDKTRPMHRLSEQFIEIMKTYTNARYERVFSTDTLKWRRLNFNRLGVFINNKGMEQSLFVDSLSGCELDISVPLYRLQYCIVC